MAITGSTARAVAAAVRSDEFDGIGSVRYCGVERLDCSAGDSNMAVFDEMPGAGFRMAGPSILLGELVALYLGVIRVAATASSGLAIGRAAVTSLSPGAERKRAVGSNSVLGRFIETEGCNDDVRIGGTSEIAGARICGGEAGDTVISLAIDDGDEALVGSGAIKADVTLTAGAATRIGLARSVASALTSLLTAC